jgi:hypothetical protein
MKEISCSGCGNAFWTGHGRQRYCGEDCRPKVSAYEIRRKAERDAARPTMQCAVCASDCRRRWPFQKTCGLSACVREWERRVRVANGHMAVESRYNNSDRGKAVRSRYKTSARRSETRAAYRTGEAYAKGHIRRRLERSLKTADVPEHLIELSYEALLLKRDLRTTSAEAM